eukprot:10145070-Prorocentrum_lima.AAC.1
MCIRDRTVGARLAAEAGAVEQDRVEASLVVASDNPDGGSPPKELSSLSGRLSAEAFSPQPAAGPLAPG